MRAPKEIKNVVIFGGGGLVGFQIARQVCKLFKPDELVICALWEDEIKPAAEKLKREFPEIKSIKYEYGNIFVRRDYANSGRDEIAANVNAMDQIFTDVFGNITDEKGNVGSENLMSHIILKYKPNVVVDCVNTATGISYQDVKSSSQVVKEFRDNMKTLLNKDELSPVIEKAEKGDVGSANQVVGFAKNLMNLANDPLESFPTLDNMRMMDLLLISQSIPQLVRHVILLYQSLLKAGTHAYVKVGTTGTGGMGVNIPYTHGEDKPSFTLMAKNAVGFAHTGLLFLLARSPGPVIKEIKPGAMIGYRKVDYRPINKFRKPVSYIEPKKETLGSELLLRDKLENYSPGKRLELVGIDTGENGFFTRAEFEAITYVNQMEFVTPEEIAKNVMYELSGTNTGKDVIAAIDGAVMDPSYRAGYIRQVAMNEMLEMETEKGIPSIALGELGPPQLSKFLYETHILQQFYKTLEELATDKISADELSQKVESYVLQDDIHRIITSLGLAILLRDGKTILRGATMNIPESKVHAKVKIESAKDIDKWAKQGWIDLRTENMQVWKDRAKRMLASQQNEFNEGSAGFNPGAYMHKGIHTGEVVGWVFINEMDGYRVK